MQMVTSTDCFDFVLTELNSEQVMAVFRCLSDDATIHIPAEIDGYPVRIIGNTAFIGRTSLENIVIPESVTSIGFSVFTSCTSLENIVIPDSVTSMGFGVFSSCTSLTNVTLPVGITSIEDYAFMNCSALTNITIPDGVKSIGKGAFVACVSLASVTIPNSVVSIGDKAFLLCPFAGDTYETNGKDVNIAEIDESELVNFDSYLTDFNNCISELGIPQT